MSRPGPVAHVRYVADWSSAAWWLELRKASGTVICKQGPFRSKAAAIEARAELVGSATRARYVTDQD